MIPYLSKLGISHCYASPLLKAREGSPHGYDISDHHLINPEIGTYEEFAQFAKVLKANSMGLLLDTVPNHMGASKNNPWWMDVLENGPASLYADYFDIDWHPLAEDLQNRILLPILGSSYGDVLENGELSLRFDYEAGRLWLDYYENSVPINPSSYPLVLRYRMDVLEARLGKDNAGLLEYQSIVSSFENLPAVADGSDATGKETRVRERKVALGRLVTLVAHHDEIRQFIEESLHDFQPTRQDTTTLLRLNRLLELQSFRLSNWRVASDEINYRRFFDVNDLVGVRVEDPLVFNDTHSLLMDFVEKGWVQGLRIDHPDGLYDPAEYFVNLQKEAANRLHLPVSPDWKLSSQELPLYVLIEKILAPFEKLPEEWTVHGTSGYEFVNAVNGVFVLQENESEFTKLYEKMIGRSVDFEELVYGCKKLIMKTTLNGELGGLAHTALQLCKFNWSTRDFTLYNLRSALMEVVASFPVYRTYVTKDAPISKKDREYLDWAIRRAKRKSPVTDPSIFNFIQSALVLEFKPEGYLLTPAPGASDAEAMDADTLQTTFQTLMIRFAMKFQQYTGPVMAKGLEDTSFYRYNRLISLNEVGGEPRQFGLSVTAFHHQNQERLKRTPGTLLATSTHDTKRSEDVRARINVLSEMPEEWSRHFMRWHKLNRNRRKELEDKQIAPSRNSEYLFYQTLIGIWPFEMPNADGLLELSERVEAYMLKAEREAKTFTSWINPDQAYEDALKDFVRQVITKPNDLFMDDFLSLQKWVSRLGLYNSLSQTLIKLTSPGVPDFYQGTELWDLSLVDPDNRRPVDYQKRQQVVAEAHRLLENRQAADYPSQLQDMLQTFEDGRVKAYVITAILAYRNAFPDLFAEGSYTPLEVSGIGEEHLIAYARQWQGETAIIIVPRLLYSKGLRRNALPCGKRVWHNTVVRLPDSLGLSNDSTAWNHFDGQTLLFSHADDDGIRELLIANVLEHLPVAFLTIGGGASPES